MGMAETASPALWFWVLLQFQWMCSNVHNWPTGWCTAGYPDSTAGPPHGFKAHAPRQGVSSGSWEPNPRVLDDMQ